jgi:hypothetical protein
MRAAKMTAKEALARRSVGVICPGAMEAEGVVTNVRVAGSGPRPGRASANP